MAEKKKVRPMSHRQTLALASMLTGLVPTGVDADVADGWIQRPKVFRRVVGGAIRKAICTPVGDSDFNRKCDEAVSQADRELGALDAEAEIDAKIDRLAQKTDGFFTRYDQSLGLMTLIRDALGPNNVGHYNSDITPERFPLKGTGVRTTNVRVESFLYGETGEQAAKRLIAGGHVLANTGDLAGFLASYPKEVEKWTWVVALSEDSRWARPDGYVVVPCTDVDGASRGFYLDYFRRVFPSVSGVLVLCE